MKPETRISLFALLFVTKSKSQTPETLGDGSTHHVYKITEPCPALPDGEPSDLCHRNPWLEPNEWKISHWLVSLKKCLAILDFFENSLLQNSTRHLVQRNRWSTVSLTECKSEVCEKLKLNCPSGGKTFRTDRKHWGMIVPISNLQRH